MGIKIVAVLQLHYMHKKTTLTKRAGKNSTKLQCTQKKQERIKEGFPITSNSFFFFQREQTLQIGENCRDSGVVSKHK